MENPVLERPDDMNRKAKKKLFLSLAIAFLIFALGFLFVVVFTYGKSNVKAPAPSFNDEDMPVSSPGITVGEPNPNTPMPIESELTYTFPEAYGFQFTYTAADWTVLKEPTVVAGYSPTGEQVSANGNNLLTLQSTTNSNNRIDFYFKSAISGMIQGNPVSSCSTDFKIIKEQGPLGSDGVSDSNKGLIRMMVPGNGYVYANNYYPGNTANEKCIMLSHPIFKIEDVDGGTSNGVGDTNNIYWIAVIATNADNTQLNLVDQMMLTIKFK